MHCSSSIYLIFTSFSYITFICTHAETRGVTQIILRKLESPTRCLSCLQAQKKGLKSHQPLRMFLLRLNWPKPLHIKLQKKKNCWRRKAGGGDWHQPPPLASYSPFRSGICGLFTEQFRHTGSKLWCLNSLWLFRREVRTSNMACDLFMLSRLCTGDQWGGGDNGRSSRLLWERSSCFGFIVLQVAISKLQFLKHITIFSLLAPSDPQHRMKNISAAACFIIRA